MRLIHLLPATLAAGLLFAVPAHAQAARNYDCTKAGNANKTVCKQAAAAPKPAAAGPVATKTTTTRHYDCSKAGNATKAVCKGAATTTMAAPAAPATRAAPVPAPAPASSVARAPSVSRSTTSHTVSTSTTKPTNTNAAGPNGATAICNDGTYSKSAHRSGTCSRHGGVKTFY